MLFMQEDISKHRVIPYLKVGKDVKVALVDAANQDTLDFLENKSKESNLNFSLSIISKTSLNYCLGLIDNAKVDAFILEQKEDDKIKKYQDTKITDAKSAAEAAKKSNTTELLETLLEAAMKLNASDLHVEPSQNDFLIRFRIDGVLQDIVTLPLGQYKQMVSRIKFLSSLRMDINNLPQDGRFSFASPTDEKVDFRVSIMPSSNGESLVLRLLGQEKAILTLDKLGFRPDALGAIKEAISKPHGMVLTSGPTGSGKSSTLYAILMEIKKPGVKIITLEDPVEYKIDGIEQSQVRPGQNYDFADGLRASLRQDPDILMVGEIRDKDTAEIAVQAALTGHLLISTIHANSAPAVYARLLEIGVKPFLLSGSINLIMAQRLVRKVCPFCHQEYQPEAAVWKAVLETLTPLKGKGKMPEELEAKLTDKPPVLVHGGGCGKCNGGYLGRQVIIEVLIPDGKVETLISRSATISEFETVAAEIGMVTMEQDGMIKALNGETTIEEVWRVTKS
jgi:type II secretory ATPase GspE/PulE/Tfp pilus assembly ATPase PilB-like protein